MVKDFFFLATSTVLQRRLRSWLTMIGIVIGITGVVAILSLGIGVERAIMDYVGEIFGLDTIMIIGVEMIMGVDEQMVLVPRLIDIDLDIVRRVEGVVAVAPIRSERGGVVEDEPPVSERLLVVGLSPEMVTEFRAFIGEFPIAEGRMLMAGDERKTVVGYAVAQRLGARPGATIEIEGQSFEVVGIMEMYPGVVKAPMGDVADLEPIFTDDSIFIPFAMMEEVFNDAGAPLFLAKAGVGERVEIVAERIDAALAEADIVAVRVDVVLAEADVVDIVLLTFEKIAEPIRRALHVVKASLAGLAAIALLVGGVGVMNTMYTSVLERTREIGVMKAVGAQNRHILSIFLIESGLMGLLGGIIGVVLGLLLSVGTALLVHHLVDDVTIIPGISASLIGGAILFSFLLGALAGMLPAMRASKLSPVEAFRYE